MGPRTQSPVDRLEPERRSEQEQRSAGRPRLGLEGVRVLDRDGGVVSLEAGEELR